MNLAALLSEAQRQLQAGQPAAAAEAFSRVLTQQPAQGDALLGLGVALAQQGRLHDALAPLTAASRALPDRADVAFNLALALQMTGDRTAALEGFRTATRLDPRHQPAWSSLGTALLGADATAAEAATAFETALALQPQDGQALLGLGFCRRRQGRLADAIAAFRAAHRLAPDEPRALANLAGALLDNREPEACRALLAGHAAAQRNPDLATTLAVAQLELEQGAAAADTLRRALALAPGHTRALGHLQLALASAGQAAALRPSLDYARLTQEAPIPPPPGYLDRAAFHAALTAQLLAEPSLRPDREGKTTRGGRQTANLVPQASGAVAALIGQLRPAIEAYFAAPPAPWRPAAPARWRLVLWATVLDHGGHQDPHNHPSGVLSGVYYLAAPDAAGSGGLLLGAVPVRFANRAPVTVRPVQPVEGLAVLFPSWLWHATQPTAATTRRISLAFDVVPMR